MLSFIEYLKELSFQYKGKLRYIEGNDIYSAKFLVNNMEYIIDATDLYGKWIINFYQTKDYYGDDTVKLKNINDVKLTFQIFGAVKEFIFNFIEKKNPETFHYLCDKDEKSRRRLYTRFSKELDSIIDNYTLEIFDIGDIMFKFERNENG